MGQQSISVNDKINPPQVCGWCDAPAIDEVILEPERYRYKRYQGETIKELAKRAITAGVCKKHRRILDQQPGDKPDTYRIKK